MDEFKNMNAEYQYWHDTYKSLLGQIPFNRWQADLGFVRDQQWERRMPNLSVVDYLRLVEKLQPVRAAVKRAQEDGRISTDEAIQLVGQTLVILDDAGITIKDLRELADTLVPLLRGMRR